MYALYIYIYIHIYIRIYGIPLCTDPVSSISKSVMYHICEVQLA